MIDDVFADWLESSEDPQSSNNEARPAIDAYRDFLRMPNSSSLDTLYLTACHPRSVIWEVGLPLLARLAERFYEARSRIERMTLESKAEVRRRSIQFISDRYSKSFCIAVLTRLLRDRSAKVRDFATSRICYLNLREMLPDLENAIENESDTETQHGMSQVFHLMRDGYFFDDRPEHESLWLYYPELFPAASPWVRDAQLRWEKGDAIDEIKADTLLAHPDFNLCRRAWEWPS